MECVRPINLIEEWKTVDIPGVVPNYYQISNHGRLMNAKGQILKPAPAFGYYAYRLYTGNKNKKYISIFIHRLVMMYFSPIENYNELTVDHHNYIPKLPQRVMRKCELLHIQAESQNTALRIFSTLNDRGKPLADSDIFKVKLYNFYKSKNKKDEFIEEWKVLENLIEEYFNSKASSPMDELFTRYMYYERAKQNITASTTDALRKFFEQEDYKLLKSEETFNNLGALARFWKNVYSQDDIFSQKVLNRLYVLKYAPNGMWTYILSVYYIANKDNLDQEKLYNFLTKITAFIYAYYFTNPGVNALRTPFYSEMERIVHSNNNELKDYFKNYKFNKDELTRKISEFVFSNNKTITKSMLIWYLMNDDTQEQIEDFQIEHIYSKNRYEKEDNGFDINLIESIGNKVILEKKINISASDYRFDDKKKYYMGKAGKNKQVTQNRELRLMAENRIDFTKEDIENRKEKIINSFIKFVESNNLIKE